MSKITKINIQAMHVGQSVFMECADMAITIAFGPNWSSEQAYGKMDPIATFSHVSREMSFNLVLLAKTLGEAKTMQGNVDKFIKFQYPKYKAAGPGGTGVLEAPPFFKVSVLDDRLYSAVEGYITAFDVTPGSQEDVAPLVGGAAPFFYERKWTINFTMTVLHDELVGWMGGRGPGGEKGFVFVAAEASTPALSPSPGGIQGSGFGPQGSGMGPTQTPIPVSSLENQGETPDSSVSDVVQNQSESTS